MACTHILPSTSTGRSALSVLADIPAEISNLAATMPLQRDRRADIMIAIVVDFGLRAGRGLGGLSKLWLQNSLDGPGQVRACIHSTALSNLPTIETRRAPLSSAFCRPDPTAWIRLAGDASGMYPAKPVAQLSDSNEINLFKVRATTQK